MTTAMTTTQPSAVATRAAGMSPATALGAKLRQPGLPEQIRAALPDPTKLDRFCRNAMTALAKAPELTECKVESVLMALYHTASLGLELGPLQEAHLVKFGGDAQLIIGYKGLLKLARNSGEITNIYAAAVYREDAFVWTQGTSPRLDHTPSLTGARNDSDLIAFYAVAFLRGSDTPQVEVMTLAEVNKVRQSSRSGNGGPWKQWFAEMGKKTVLRRLCKTLPMALEFAEALDHEDAFETTPPRRESSDAPPASRFTPPPEPGGTVIDATAEPASTLAPPPDDAPRRRDEPGSDG